MLKTLNNDGIKCDLCGAEYRHQFTYYSYDFYDYRVGLKPDSIQNTLSGKIILSVDVCEICHKTNCDLIIKNNAIIHKLVKCDLSGVVLAPNLIHKYCIVDEAVVNLTNKNISIDKRILDIVVSDTAYKSMVDKITNISKVNEWSAK